ncbi:MAG: NHL repeat-containing protein [Chthoniobacterales bacterium]
MKQNVFLLLAILLCVLVVEAAAETSSAAEIWISYRTDGIPGTGTASDPFDGHTALLFDKIMRGIAPATIVHIGPGLFRTTGSFSYNESNGYYLPVGCKIIGAGQNETTIRCTYYPAAAGVNGHSVLESSSAVDGAGIEVTDLTVDCNWQNLHAAAASRISAVNLRGNNCAIRRVTAINAYGNSASLAETFVLTIEHYYSSSGWQSVTGAVIEDCAARSFLGDYGSAMDLFGGGDDNGTISGVIQRCRVDDWNGTSAYGSAGADGVTFIDNETYNCKSSIYFDTGHLKNFEITGNHFYGILLRGIQCSPSLGAALIENLSIHDNFFEVSDAQTPELSAIAVSANEPGHEKQISITYNTVMKKLTGTNNPIAGIATAYCDNLFVAHNWVDSALQNFTYVDGPYFNTDFRMSDNVDEKGRRPAGLGDIPAAESLPTQGGPGNSETSTGSSGDILYLSDFGDSTVLQYDSAGNQSSFTSAFVNGATGIALDAAGNVYVSTGTNGIEKFGPNGSDLGAFASTGLNLPMALAFDHTGNLYAANYAGNTVEKFAPDGTDLGPFANVIRPTGVAFDATGDLYVANFGNTIERFGSDGTAKGTFASTGLNNPEGLAFDSSGNLYVANSGLNTIERFSSAGTDLGVFGSEGLSGPIGLVFDSKGDLYVSNSQISTIEKFAPDGTASLFAATGFSPAFLAVQKSPVLVNISTRLLILTDNNVLDSGFILTGSGTKTVLIRGLGPSLAAAGIQDVLADPIIEFHSAATGTIIASNDNWKNNQQTEIAGTGIPPTNDAEAALITTLPPGAYTVIERGKLGTTGVGLIEIYDLGPGFGPELANISTRGLVGTRGDVMIAGFIAASSSGGSGQVLVRALGPSLGGAGVSDFLADPVLELHDSNGALIAVNDNWKSDQQTEIEATGVPPTNDAEAAIVANLAPGEYTAIESGKNGGSGVGLVEIYNLH